MSKTARKYCSDACVRKGVGSTLKQKGIRPPITPRMVNNVVLVCSACGDLYAPNYTMSTKRLASRKYCSDKCRKSVIKKYDSRREAKAAYSLRRRIRDGKNTEHTNCSNCGRTTRSYLRKYCSDTCKAEKTKRDSRAVKECKVCGDVFVCTRNSEIYCSVKCAKKVSRNIRKHKGRAKKYGSAYESVATEYVLARDGWVCQICGTDTPAELRGSYVDNAPEIDHIVPLALGGGHVLSNLQCSCRKCNAIKGASLPASEMIKAGEFFV